MAKSKGIPENAFDSLMEEREAKRDPAPREPLVQRQVRLTDSDWKALQAHFQDRGLSVSGGIRFVLREYMRKNGI